MLEWTYYVRVEDLFEDYVLWEGLEDILFSKISKNGL